MHRTVGPLPGL